MFEMNITSPKTPLDIPSGARVYVSCLATTTFKLKVCDKLFKVESVPRGNHIVDLPAGEYVVIVPAQHCGDCTICVEQNAISLDRDLELVCLKSKANPLDAPIKAWAMAFSIGGSETLSVRVISFDGITELVLDEYDVVECCC